MAKPMIGTPQSTPAKPQDPWYTEWGGGNSIASGTDAKWQALLTDRGYLKVPPVYADFRKALAKWLQEKATPLKSVVEALYRNTLPGSKEIANRLEFDIEQFSDCVAHADFKAVKRHDFLAQAAGRFGQTLQEAVACAMQFQDKNVTCSLAKILRTSYHSDVGALAQKAAVTIRNAPERHLIVSVMSAPARFAEFQAAVREWLKKYNVECQTMIDSLYVTTSSGQASITLSRVLNKHLDMLIEVAGNKDFGELNIAQLRETLQAFPQVLQRLASHYEGDSKADGCDLEMVMLMKRDYQSGPNMLRDDIVRDIKSYEQGAAR